MPESAEAPRTGLGRRGLSLLLYGLGALLSIVAVYAVKRAAYSAVSQVASSQSQALSSSRSSGTPTQPVSQEKTDASDLGIPDDANYWIWRHISEGNYENSDYVSEAGFTSFKKCLTAVNPKIVSGAVYDYDFARQTANPRPTPNQESLEDVKSAFSEPDVTLLKAVILTTDQQNPYRLAMAEDLLKAGADPDQRSGKLAQTPLMTAVIKGDTAMVQLIAPYADRKVTDINGAAAIDYAASSTIKSLLQ